MVNVEDTNNSDDLVSGSSLFDDRNVVREGDNVTAQVNDDTPLCNHQQQQQQQQHDNVSGTADHPHNGTKMRNQNKRSLNDPDGGNVMRETAETINGRMPSADRNSDAPMHRLHTAENRPSTVLVTNYIDNDRVMVTGRDNSESNDELATKIDDSGSILSCDGSQNDTIDVRTTDEVKTCVQCATPMLQSGDAAAVLVVCGGNNKINNSACETSNVENTEKHSVNNVQYRTKSATKISVVNTTDDECNNTGKLSRLKVKRMQAVYMNHLGMERDTRLIADDDGPTRRQYRRSPRGISKPTISTSSSSSSISSAMHEDDDETTTEQPPCVSLRCSLPLEKINASVLDSIKKKSANENDDEKINGPKKRFLCLFCERIFASANLRQKHVERCHSANQSRRSSSRTPGHNHLVPSCMYCGKADDLDNDLHRLLQHLVAEHSSKYHACVPCEERFSNRDALQTHQFDSHGIKIEEKELDDPKKRRKKKSEELLDESSTTKESDDINDLETDKIKKMKCIPRTTRTTRRTAAMKSRTDPETSTQKVLVDRLVTAPGSLSEGTTTKMSNGETVPVNYEFDENFFRCVAFNIRDNLLNHLDGKLNRDRKEVSECPMATSLVTMKHSNVAECTGAANTRCSENLALTALTPVTTLLTSQIGIDAYRQIEYGSKPPPEMIRTRHYVKYNFRSRKNKQNENECDIEQRDISKLDMWTQIAMKLRQQKVNKNGRMHLHCQTELFSGAGEISMQVEELNRILDTRGPFQDLREENQQFMTGTRPQDTEQQHEDNVDEVRAILEDLINSVVSHIPKTTVNRVTRSRVRNEKSNVTLSVDDESLTYLNLSRIKNVEAPTQQTTTTKLGLDLKPIDPYLSEADHNLIVASSVELSGEWARPRIYICGACGVKLPSLKQLEDHKSFVHPYIWCMHYEFVGNQSEFYPHLNIPGLGRILEKEKRDRYNREHDTEVVWERSDARICTKCNRQCNSLGELHRHMLECGGDWAWMLAKKKCKYRPYGTRRRRQRGMKRNFVRVIDKNEQRKYREKTKTDGPRPPRPSDADTIQRMLANLPAKRATRKIMCLKDGGHRKPRQKPAVNQTTSSKKESTMKAANQKLKQALQKNLRSRNQLNKGIAEEAKITPRKAQKVLASTVIESNTAQGPKSKMKKLRFTDSVMKITRLRHKLLAMQNGKKDENHLVDKKQPNRTRIFKKIQKKLPTFRRSLRINNSTTVSENESADVEASVSGLKRLTRSLRNTTKKLTEKTVKIFKKEQNNGDDSTKIFDKRKRKINNVKSHEDENKKTKLDEEGGQTEENVKIPVLESVGAPFDVQIDSAITLPILVSVPVSTSNKTSEDQSTSEPGDQTMLLIAPENCDLSDTRILKNSNTSASATESCETSPTCVEVDVQLSQDTGSMLPTTSATSSPTPDVHQPLPEPSQNAKSNPIDPSKHPEENLPPLVIKTEPPDFPSTEQVSSAKISRLKKPVRKLNDCIAMLTCKLQQKLQTQPTSSSSPSAPSSAASQPLDSIDLIPPKSVGKSVLNVPILKVPAVNHLRYDFLQHKPTDYDESVNNSPVDYTYSNLTKTLSLQSPPAPLNPVPLVSYSFVPKVPNPTIREEIPKSCTVLNVPKLPISSTQETPLCLKQTKPEQIVHSTTNDENIPKPDIIVPLTPDQDQPNLDEKIEVTTKEKRAKKNGGLAKLNQVVDQLTQKINEITTLVESNVPSQDQSLRKTRNSQKKVDDLPVEEPSAMVAVPEQPPVEVERKIGRSRAKKIESPKQTTSPKKVISPKKIPSPKKTPSPKKAPSPKKSSPRLAKIKSPAIIESETIDEVLTIEIENKAPRGDNEDDVEIDVVTVEPEKGNRQDEKVTSKCSDNESEVMSKHTDDESKVMSKHPDEENKDLSEEIVSTEEFKHADLPEGKQVINYDILEKPRPKVESRKIGRARKKETHENVEIKMKNVDLIIEDIIKQYSMDEEEEKGENTVEEADLNTAFISKENETVPVEISEEKVDIEDEKIPTKLPIDEPLSADLVSESIESMKSTEIPEAIERSEEAETPENFLEQPDENIDINENNNINIESLKKFAPKTKRIFKTRKKIRRGVQKVRKKLKIFDKTSEVLPLSEKIIESENITPESVTGIPSPISSPHATTNQLPLFEPAENPSSEVVGLHENKENSNVESNEPKKPKVVKSKKRGVKRKNVGKKISKLVANDLEQKLDSVEVSSETTKVESSETKSELIESTKEEKTEEIVEKSPSKSDDSEDELPLAKIITKLVEEKVEEDVVFTEEKLEENVVETPSETVTKPKLLHRMPKIKLRRRKVNKKKSKIFTPKIIEPSKEVLDEPPVPIVTDAPPPPEDDESVRPVDKTPPHSPILIRIKTSQIKPQMTDHYCDICKKKFCRAENLAKHKMTFTHIAKLSEIEAREHALRLAENQVEEEKPMDNTDHVVEPPGEPEEKVDRDSDEDLMEPFTLGVGVNYPDLVTSHQPKRYRSLGERKSFDSNPSMLSPARFEDIQRTLEEEEDEEVFHDDKSNSSIDDFRDNSPLNSPIYYPEKTIDKPPIVQRDPNLIFDYLKKSGPENHKNVVFEENQFSDNFVRKTLNRDEELFLECCSLLKNNSKHRPITNENKTMEKSSELVDGPDWSNSNSIESDWLSRPDESSSNTQFSNILVNNTSYQWLRQKESLESFDTSNDNSNFLKKCSEENSSIDSSSQSASVSTTHQTSIRDYVTSGGDAAPGGWEDLNNDSKKIPTKGALKVFEGIKVSIPTQELNLEQVLNCSNSQSSSLAPPAPKLKLYKNGVEVSQSILTKTKTSKSTAKKCGNKLGMREFKKRTKGAALKRKSIESVKDSNQIKDVYDFEESQDEVELVPPSKTFKMFRDKTSASTPAADGEVTTTTCKNPLLDRLTSFISEEDSESDQHAYLDSFSIDESSTRSSDDYSNVKPALVVTPSSTGAPKRKVRRTNGLTKKATTKTNENHKKCMIMGRIFKHVVKPKTPEVLPDKPDTFNENDINLNKNINRIMSPASVTQEKPPLNVPAVPNKTIKSAVKKNRKVKRVKNHEESSDDEFSPKKGATKTNCKRKKPRQKPKVNVKEDSGINLEQEIRECIGVAGRKSQRKCTSGKQNVLAEFWSSDEEQSELEENVDEPPRVPVETSTNISESVMITDKIDQLVEEPIIDNTKVVKPRGKVVRKNRKTKVEPPVVEVVEEVEEVKEDVVNPTEETGKVVGLAASRRKRSASEKLYYWSSSSDDEVGDLIEVKPIRDDGVEDDRPLQHGWIVGDSPKKLVTMLAQAKGKKMVDSVSVKEQGRRNKLTS